MKLLVSRIPYSGEAYYSRDVDLFFESLESCNVFGYGPYDEWDNWSWGDVLADEQRMAYGYK